MLLRVGLLISSSPASGERAVPATAIIWGSGNEIVWGAGNYLIWGT